MPLSRRFSSPCFGAVLRVLSAGVAALSFGLVGLPSAGAASPFLVVPEPAVAEATPAYRYANMTDEEAFAELDKRQILYQRLGSVHGIRAPIRLTGRLHGVNFHSSLPPEQRVTSIFEILDARLALALDDFAAVLARHDIDEVVHYTMYRPNVPRPGHDDHDDDGGGKSAERAPVAQRRAGESPAGASPKQVVAAPPKQLGDAHAPKKTVNSKASKPSGRARAAASKPAEAGGKAPVSGKSSLSGKASLDSKKAGREAPSAVKQKSAPALSPKSSSVSAPIAPSKPSKAVSGPKAGIRFKTSWAPPGTRHPAGLAIDVGMLRKRDGRWLSVAGHFRGKIGEKTCGDGAPAPLDADARELRAIVCEASELGIFTYVLTPNYNAAHADHYHMEIKPGVRWFLYH